MNPTVLNSTDANYPARLRERLGEDAPRTLTGLGAPALLSQPKTGLFCSVRCPGDKILAAYDTARKLRDDGIAVISGFHSPVEKECLRILLRGNQPIIICLARALEKIRLPADWRRPLQAGRLLVIAPFEKRPRRPTTESSYQRNELIASLSDEAIIIHAEPGGRIERISELVKQWKIPLRTMTRG
ncbi:MAG: DNA-processing protein DprA [Candidatus Binatia bacterium]